MTNEERVEAYLRRIAPRSATNAEIARNTAVQPHNQVFQITRRLLEQGRLKGGRDGNAWRFWIDPSSVGPLMPDSRPPSPVGASEEVDQIHAARSFEGCARSVMSRHYGTELTEGTIPGVPKRFDFISADKTIIGDAKFFSLVRGEMLPPAKFSIIGEHIWLLEKTKAAHLFLVFGNDRRVPMRWLEKYGSLRSGAEFFFIDADRTLTHLG